LKADRISETVKHAEYGYSGLFDPIKIQREELLGLLKFDDGLVGTVHQISDCTEDLLKMSREGEDINDQLNQLETSLEGFDNTFKERRQFMQGLKG
jgi:predicted  nucleic acid-binding Zn-ribbon protein